MSKTILITGTSSGIGCATAKYFQERGWNVAATMRNPQKETKLGKLSGVKVFKLDVLDEGSIHKAVKDSIREFRGIDVIVNNAGYAAFGPFEAATNEQIERQFKTNLFGAMHLIRAVLPYFREKNAGMIINVSSVGGRLTFPLNSLYHASKFALEGFSESLYYELEPFNIKVKLVEPGGVKTDFASRSADWLMNSKLKVYDDLVNKFKNSMKKAVQFSDPSTIAAVIYEAAIDGTTQLRYVAGRDAVQLLAAREKISQEEYYQMMKKNLLG